MRNVTVISVMIIRRSLHSVYLEKSLAQLRFFFRYSPFLYVGVSVFASLRDCFQTKFSIQVLVNLVSFLYTRLDLASILKAFLFISYSS